MDVREATVRYEKWMATHIKIVNRDLVYKHQQMGESSFAFMRATFYRWLQIWKDLGRVEAEAPRLLAIGDLHIENFGTWRDAEGRLIWGVNDFDESHLLPYTNDLVRLATSALLAIESEHLTIRRRDACDAILTGYLEGMRSGGRPFVLGEEHVFLRDIALSKLRDPVHFWARMRELPNFRQTPSAEVAEALELLLPEAKIPYRIKARRAGLGSLGRLRLVALAEWRGGLVAREAKSARPCHPLAFGRDTPAAPVSGTPKLLPEPYAFRIRSSNYTATGSFADWRLIAHGSNSGRCRKSVTKHNSCSRWRMKLPISTLVAK
jgi:Uncharacterized protein conserved in bacteria (DUF2252)